MKKNRKKPERTCVVCRSKKDKRDLIRIVRYEDEFHIDPTGKKNGRGAYVCKNDQCIHKFLDKNFMERAYRQKIDNQQIQTVKKELKKYLENADSEDQHELIVNS